MMCIHLFLQDNVSTTLYMSVVFQHVSYDFKGIKADTSGGQAGESSYQKHMRKLRDRYGEEAVIQFKKKEGLRQKMRRIKRTPQQVEHEKKLSRLRKQRYRMQHRRIGMTEERTISQEKRQRLREYPRRKKQESRQRKSDAERFRARLAKEKLVVKEEERQQLLGNGSVQYKQEENDTEENVE